MQYSELPQLTHERVTLRELTGADAATWYAYLSLPSVHEHTSWNISSAGDLAHYFATNALQDPGSAVRFAIALRSSDELAGTAGFHTVSTLNRSAELAYDLAPAYWGQGIATAVCEALVEWAFAHVGLVRVQATALESNARSMKVLERCGFECEGLLRSYRMVRGRPGNFWMYSRIRAAAPVGA